MKLSCPQCDSCEITTEMMDHRFPYGWAPNVVELSATVPLRQCGDCSNLFLDDEAEDLMHEAICKHNGMDSA